MTYSLAEKYTSNDSWSLKFLQDNISFIEVTKRAQVGSEKLENDQGRNGGFFSPSCLTHGNVCYYGLQFGKIKVKGG